MLFVFIIRSVNERFGIMNDQTPLIESNYYRVGTYAIPPAADVPNPPRYEVIVKFVNEKQDIIIFQIFYAGLNGSPVYFTNDIICKVINHIASFHWKDSWDNEGEGSLEFNNNNIIVNMQVTKKASVNRFLFSIENKVYEYQNSNKKEESPTIVKQ